MTVRESHDAEPLESGDVFFVYRPRVDEHDVDRIDDIQQLFMILRPRAGGPFRRIVLRRKQLPAPEASGRQRFWGFVDEVRRDPSDLDLERDPERYRTKTRGERVQPEDRPVGEGVYAVTRHDGHTHLSYELELPQQPGEPQHELHLEREASYIVAVKNPAGPSPRGVGLQPRRRAELPQRLQRLFRGGDGGERKFVDLDPPGFLDHAGVELVFVAASGDPHAELGLDLDEQDESARSAETVRELGMDPGSDTTRPLLDSEWE